MPIEIVKDIDTAKATHYLWNEEKILFEKSNIEFTIAHFNYFNYSLFLFWCLILSSILFTSLLVFDILFSILMLFLISALFFYSITKKFTYIVTEDAVYKSIGETSDNYLYLFLRNKDIHVKARPGIQFSDLDNESKTITGTYILEEKRPDHSESIINKLYNKILKGRSIKDDYNYLKIKDEVVENEAREAIITNKL
jgi:uncharacterized membrane protein